MITAIIPIKRLETAKRRLSDVLSQHDRKQLCLAMLRDVLEVLNRLPRITEICIVTPDDELSSLIGCDTAQNRADHNKVKADHNKVKADHEKVRVIREPEQTNLNGALLYARSKVSGNGNTHLLYIPGDVPLISVEEIEVLLELHQKSYITTGTTETEADKNKQAWAVIVPDKNATGTNFLLLHPPSIIDPCFGPNSYQEHLRRIKKKNIPYVAQERFGLTRDIDTPDDLAILYRYGCGTRSYDAIHELGVVKRLSLRLL